MEILKMLALYSSVLCAGVASAANNNCSPSVQYSGPYANVSAAGNASKTAPIIACTVVRPYETVTNATAIFSETDTGDAILEVKYTEGMFPNRIVDDWASNLSANDIQNLIWQLRTPARATDAVIVLSSDWSYYNNSLILISPHVLAVNPAITFGVCAYGYPKEGTAWTSVSISSLGIQNKQRYQTTDASDTSNYCYNPPTVFFEHL